MKSLAEFKRDVNSGILSAEMIEFHGSTEIPELIRGIRKIVQANSVGVKLETDSGKISELGIPAAALIEYDGETLTVYNPALRDFTPDEKLFLEKWDKIASTDEFKKRAGIDAITDGAYTYWKKELFFKQGGYEYLLGGKKQAGKIYDLNAHKVRDYNIKGTAALKYKIYKQATNS